MTGSTRGERGKLGGLKRRQVIRELALQEINRSQIAEKYGVTPGAITQFADRYADEIRAVAAAIDDEFAGILIAQKANRLASYQDLHELAITPTPKIAPNGKLVREWVPDEDGVMTEVVVHEVDVRAAAQVLKQAAEEMGQLPTRLQIQGDMQTTTTYKIENVNPEDLK